MMLVGFTTSWETTLAATTTDVEDRRPSPTLSDYARSVWRRKGLVAGGLVLGLLLGLLVFPRILPSEPKYDARARLDVRSLAVTPDGQGDGSGSAGAPLGVERWRPTRPPPRPPSTASARRPGSCGS